MKLYTLLKRLRSFFYPRHRLQKFRNAGVGITLPSNGVIDHAENIELGNYIYIGSEPYIFARGGLTIGDNVVIGPRVTIHTTNHNYQPAKYLPYDDITYCKPVSIEKNVWIGSNVLICPGVRIAEGCVVAMGSVVTKNLPPFSIIGGNPAQVLKERDQEEYQRLDKAGMHFLKYKAQGKTNPTYIEPKSHYGK